MEPPSIKTVCVLVMKTPHTRGSCCRSSNNASPLRPGSQVCLETVLHVAFSLPSWAVSWAPQPLPGVRSAQERWVLHSYSSILCYGPARFTVYKVASTLWGKLKISPGSSSPGGTIRALILSTDSVFLFCPGTHVKDLVFLIHHYNTLQCAAISTSVPISITLLIETVICFPDQHVSSSKSQA